MSALKETMLEVFDIADRAQDPYGFDPKLQQVIAETYGLPTTLVEDMFEWRAANAYMAATGKEAVYH